MGGFNARLLKQRLLDLKDKQYVHVDDWYRRIYGNNAEQAVRESNIFHIVSEAMEDVTPRIGPRYTDKPVSCESCSAALTSDQKFACFKRANLAKHTSWENYERYMFYDKENPVLPSGLLDMNANFAAVQWLCDTCFRIEHDRKQQMSLGNKLRAWLNL